MQNQYNRKFHLVHSWWSWGVSHLLQSPRVLCWTWNFSRTACFSIVSSGGGVDMLYIFVWAFFGGSLRSKNFIANDYFTVIVGHMTSDVPDSKYIVWETTNNAMETDSFYPELLGQWIFGALSGHFLFLNPVATSSAQIPPMFHIWMFFTIIQSHHHKKQLHISMRTGTVSLCFTEADAQMWMPTSM